MLLIWVQDFGSICIGNNICIYLEIFFFVFILKPCAILDFYLTPVPQPHNLVLLQSPTGLYDALVFRIFCSPAKFYQV